MYLVNTIEKRKIQTPMITMFVSFSDADIEKADRLEVWGTKFNESSEFTDDHCEFRLMNGDNVIAKRIVEGY